MTAPRPLAPVERDVLDGFLAWDFEGVAALREQARDVTAGPGCSCGCGSITLFPSSTSPASDSASPAPVEGVLRGDAGVEVGGLLLFLDAGRLSYLEVFSYGDPLPLPEAARVEWVGADGSTPGTDRD